MAVRALAPGVTGVVLFFLISGYIIPFSAREPFDPGRFLVRRLFRIYPLFLAALAMVTVLGICGVLSEWNDLAAAGLERWLPNLLLVQELVGARPILGVSWTLIIEFVWYGLFAASLIAFQERAAGILTAGLGAIILGLVVLSLVLEQRIPVARVGMVYAAAFGFQLYRYATDRINRRKLLLQLAVFLGVTLAANFVSFGLFGHARVGLWQALLPWLIAPLAFTALVMAPELQSASALAQGWLPRCGQWSYSLYLLHPIGVALAFEMFEPGLALLAGTGFSLALAWAGYNLVELPGISLGRRLSPTQARAAMVKA